MQELTYHLSFDEASADDASYFAEELRDQLLDVLPGTTVTRIRDDQHTQDFGSILQIILSASSVIALASALGNWLILHRKASITVKRNGELVAKNITSQDVVRLAEIMQHQQSYQKGPSELNDIS